MTQKICRENNAQPHLDDVVGPGSGPVDAGRSHHSGQPVPFHQQVVSACTVNSAQDVETGRKHESISNQAREQEKQK